MSIKDKFNQEFQPVIADVILPERLADHYRPESCLLCREGREVWLLRDDGGGRYVLKIDRTGRRDLAGEFSLMAHLPQDLAGRVPMPVDCFEEDGVWYLLRTYLPGRPLSETWEPGDVPRCVELGKKLCALLERLHSLDEPVIHRDIKPENIILSPEGEPGLIDFGIARVYKEGRDSDTVCMGTRSTAPPEQYGYAQTDRRADVYSLGVTLRWMLTGSYEPDALEKADCPEGLKRCLDRASSFDPDKRYPSAKAFGRALAGSLKRPRRRGLLAAAACLAALALILCWPRSSPVKFDSDLLEQAVRYELDKPEGAVTVRDLEQVERLAVVGRNLLGAEQNYRYTAFGYIDNVPQLDEPCGDISDLSLLTRMPNLRELYLCQQEITDLSPLEGLPLRELYLCDNQIEDLTPLSKLSNLQTLYLGNNPMDDLTPLASLRRLEELNLDSYYDGRVDSFVPLTGLPVVRLSLNNTSPRDGDWSPLEALGQAEELYLWDPPEAALTHLSGMDSLRRLGLGDFQGQDLTGLNLPRLTWLGLSFHVNSLEGIQRLESLAYLDLEGMDGLSLEPLTQLERLSFISVNGCQNMDYTPLLRIPSLETVETWDEQCRQELERACPEGVRTFRATGV